MPKWLLYSWKHSILQTKDSSKVKHEIMQEHIFFASDLILNQYLGLSMLLFFLSEIPQKAP